MFQRAFRLPVGLGVTLPKLGRYHMSVPVDLAYQLSRYCGSQAEAVSCYGRSLDTNDLPIHHDLMTTIAGHSKQGRCLIQ
jgi:hypothetical protein